MGRYVGKVHESHIKVGLMGIGKWAWTSQCPRGHHWRGSARVMSQNEDSGYCEQNGYKKPSSVKLVDLIMITKENPAPSHGPPGLSTKTPHTNRACQSVLIILTPQTVTHVLRQSIADALGLKLCRPHTILKIQGAYILSSGDAKM